MASKDQTTTRDPIVDRIIEGVGGAGNVDRLTHCVTRLRFELTDPDQADLKALGAIPGVLRAQNAAGQTQVVVGDKVEKLYKQIDGELNPSGTAPRPKGDSVSTPKRKENVVSRLIAVIASIFTPALPALIGAGMIKALTSVLSLTGVLVPDTTLFVVMTMVGDSVFYFLPLILAVSAAKKFDTNPYLAMLLAGVMLHPSWAAYVTAQTEGGATTSSLLGLPVLLVTYSSTVIPIILSVWILKYVSDFVTKYMPATIRIAFVPTAVTIIMVPLILVALGPAGHYVGNLIGFGVSWLFETSGWLAGAVFGGFRSILVIFGLHYSFFPIQLQELAATGGTALLIGAFAANLGQTGAALGVAALTRGSERSGAAATGFTALFGITEPAIYGYNLRYKFPFFASCIAAGITAGILGFGNVVATAFVLPNFLSFGALEGDFNLVVISGILLGTAVLSFVITVFYGKTIGRGTLQRVLAEAEAKGDPLDDNVSEDTHVDTLAASATATSESTPTTVQLVSPLTGTVVPLSEVGDALFADEVVGRGVAIRPTEGTVVSPCDGEVIMVAGTGHAIGIRADNGAEILIHVGIDTVGLEGAPFSVKVKEGDRVSSGQTVIEADLDAIVEAGLDTVTPIVVNPADVQIEVLADQSITRTTPLYRLERTAHDHVS